MAFKDSKSNREWNTEASDLEGKRVLITGGSRGIGRSTALAFAQAGARLALVARSEDALMETKIEVEALGAPPCHSLCCDVSKPKEVQETVAALMNKLWGIDILVNNAGSAASHRFLDHPDTLWFSMLDLNLNSVYYVSKAVVPYMIDQGWGRIVNVASIASKVGIKYEAAYTTAKHGVLGLTRALAAELVNHHITVNAVCPGYVDTPLTERSVLNIVDRTGIETNKVRRTLEDMNPQRRLIQPTEVAAIILMLAREVSKGITGQAINVDGGAVMY